MTKQDKVTNQEETNEDPQVEGFQITAEEVNGLNDKHFKIHAIPFYKEFNDFVDKNKKVSKIVIPVMLRNGTTAEWTANKKSQGKIIAARGRSLRDWIGFEGEWIVKEQVIADKEKLVIYLK